MMDIARQFFRFDRFLDAQPVGNGHINDTYRIDFEANTQAQRGILQRLNHQVFQQPNIVMDNMVRVCRHLGTQDYPHQIVAPLPATDGAFLTKDADGNYWRAFPWVENSFAPETVDGPEMAHEAARAYGAFARALRDFPAQTLSETIPGFHDTDKRWAYFLKTLAENPKGRAQQSAAEIAAMFRAKPVFDQIAVLKKSGKLPVRVAHNDTKAGNVLFDQNTHKALAVIDLDTVMPGTLLSDFGDMVRTFAPDCPEDAVMRPTLRPDILEALRAGFLSETDAFLTPTEKENLLLGAAWMAGEQALRFLTDWLAGDVYYKITSPDHNLLRAQNQLALFETMRYEV